MNIKRGLQRIYFFGTVLWIALVGAIFPMTIDRAWAYGWWENVLRVITTPRIVPLLGYAFLPPLVVSAFAALTVWVIRGFGKDPDEKK
jgi:hypothetical protein